MKWIYRLYQLLISPVLIVLTVLTALATIIGCSLFNASWWSYWPGRLWSRAFIRLLLLPVKIEGREHLAEGQSFVIVPNHQGAFDIFLIYGFLGRHFKWMMKSELRNMPLVGKACESAGFIFVDQHGGPKAMQATHDRARQVLREAFQLADELQLPLLPVTINGSYEVLSRKRGFNFVNWHRLSLTIHEPIAPPSGDERDERAVMTEAHDIVESALDKKYKATKE